MAKVRDDPPITSMGGMLHPPSPRARIIVALRAYFDESGTHWGGPMACDTFVLCGYLGQESLLDDKTPDSDLDAMARGGVRGIRLISGANGPELPIQDVQP